MLRLELIHRHKEASPFFFQGLDTHNQSNQLFQSTTNLSAYLNVELPCAHFPPDDQMIRTPMPSIKNNEFKVLNNRSRSTLKKVKVRDLEGRG